MAAREVELVVDAAAVLGEGPVWDPAGGSVIWVDISGRQVHVTDHRTGADRVIDVPQEVGCVMPRAGGGLVAGVRDGFAFVDLDRGSLDVLQTLDGHGPGGLRMNDGKCDPAGRFWAGGMSDDGRCGAASLHVLEPDLSVRTVLEGITISNGLGWSPDGATMFFVDTPTRGVDAFDFDAASGRITNRRRLVDVDAAVGWPDGLAVDTEGGVWVALWEGAAVHRYRPGDGLDAVVEVPTARVTSCAFAGPELDELFITTAGGRRGEAGEHAGGLFRYRPGVRGLAVPAFAG